MGSRTENRAGGGDSGPRSAPLRAGLVGCGRLGTGFYIPALARAHGLELVAVAEPDLGRRLRAVEAARRAGIANLRTFGSGRSLITGAGVDVAILAGPPEGQLELATVAAGEGVRTLVEKPPGRDAAEAAALATLDPLPWVGFNRRFGFAAPLLEAMPSGGGELTLEIRYLRRRWRPHSTRIDALDDLGSHLLDLALMIGGEEGARVRAVRLEPAAAEVEVRTERVGAHIRCAVNRPWREAISVAPRDGLPRSVRLGGIVWNVRARLARRPDPLTSSLVAQLEALATACTGGSPGPLATAADGELAMRAIEASRRSAETGDWEALAGGRAALARRGALAA